MLKTKIPLDLTQADIGILFLSPVQTSVLLPWVAYKILHGDASIYLQPATLPNLE